MDNALLKDLHKDRKRRRGDPDPSIPDDGNAASNAGQALPPSSSSSSALFTAASDPYSCKALAGGSTVVGGTMQQRPAVRQRRDTPAAGAPASLSAASTVVDLSSPSPNPSPSRGFGCGAGAGSAVSDVNVDADAALAARLDREDRLEAQRRAADDAAANDAMIRSLLEGDAGAAVSFSASSSSASSSDGETARRLRDEQAAAQNAADADMARAMQADDGGEHHGGGGSFSSRSSHSSHSTHSSHSSSSHSSSSSGAPLSEPAAMMLQAQQPETEARTDGIVSLLHSAFARGNRAAADKSARVWLARGAVSHFTQVINPRATRFSKEKRSDGYSCGYRSMQMVASALLERPEYRGRMFDGRGHVPELEVRSRDERERETVC